jgi:hypothetical protein
MAKENNGEARSSKEDVAFATLKNKIVASVKIETGTSHLLLVKKGSLTKMERDVFISLWKRNFPGTGMMIFEVEDPDKDVRAFEVSSRA